MKKLIILLILGFFSYANAANYTLEIIQPQEGLNTNNRFYKAYPGIEYNVRVAAIGGTWPNTFELTTYPSGMTINANTGEISWPNPLTSGSPHSVTVRVTDSESSTDTHSWTITVATTGFVFIDAVDGNDTNNGLTPETALQTIDELYGETKADDTWAGYFAYFMDGTYYSGDGFIEDGVRLPLTSYDKPMVWMAYPGESPIIDMTDAYIIVYAGTDNLYVEGFEIINMVNGKNTGWRPDSNGDNVTFRDNSFHGLADKDDTNMACIFITNAGIGERWVFLGNEFYDVVGGMGIEAYKSERVLVEDNIFRDFTNGYKTSHALGPKMSYRYWFIRDNTFYDNTGFNIWADGYTSSGPCDNIDISFNVVKNSAGGQFALHFNFDNGDQGQVYVYRNTFVGAVEVRWATATRGPYNFYNNVIIGADGITCDDCTSPDITETDNLEGIAEDNIVDADGLLLGTYRDDYLGIRGYEIGEDETAPEFSSAAIDGTTVVVNFSESCTRGSGYNNSDLDLDMSVAGNDIAVTYVSGDGTSQWTFTAASAAVNGESVNLDFNGDANSIEDDAGNDLAALTSETVTNNTETLSEPTMRGVSGYINTN